MWLTPCLSKVVNVSLLWFLTCQYMWSWNYWEFQRLNNRQHKCPMAIMASWTSFLFFCVLFGTRFFVGVSKSCVWKSNWRRLRNKFWTPLSSLAVFELLTICLWLVKSQNQVRVQFLKDNNYTVGWLWYFNYHLNSNFFIKIAIHRSFWQLGKIQFCSSWSFNNTDQYATNGIKLNSKFRFHCNETSFSKFEFALRS